MSARRNSIRRGCVAQHKQDGITVVHVMMLCCHRGSPRCARCAAQVWNAIQQLHARYDCAQAPIEILRVIPACWVHSYIVLSQYDLSLVVTQQLGLIRIVQGQHQTLRCQLRANVQYNRQVG
jgi:hypothetical protein